MNGEYELSIYESFLRINAEEEHRRLKILDLLKKYRSKRVLEQLCEEKNAEARQ